jgi:glycosyltransferase involved in cell wall biosynthesis
VFVTQNGDWPAVSDEAEYRFFGCDGLVCTNKLYFERSRYPSTLIGNGVDLAKFTAGPGERERLGLTCDGPLIAMASAMIDSKKIDEAIEAVSRIPDATLVVAGDGPLRAPLHRLANDKLPGRFRQVQLAASEMPAFYRTADVFLHLSREESFGNIYLEAMACGVPVVAIDSVHTRWIFGKDAFLAPTDDPEAVAELIRAALQVGSDFRRRLVAKAQGYGWAEIGRKYREFIEEILSKR